MNCDGGTVGVLPNFILSFIQYILVRGNEMRKGFGEFIQHQHIFTWIFFNEKNWWRQPGLISYSVWHLSKWTPYSSPICRLEAWCGWIGDVIVLCVIFSSLSIEAEELMYIGYTRHKVRKGKVHYQCWHITDIYQICNSGALSCIGHLSFLKAGEYAQKSACSTIRHLLRLTCGSWATCQYVFLLFLVWYSMRYKM